MKFQRLFYNSSVNFKKLTKQRVVIGILLGLLSAFTIYSFFYVIREAYRAISLGFMNYGFWSFQNGEYILSEKDRSFYNLFFSGLSLILGNSIVFLFLFSGPNNVLNRFDSRRKRLLNDQIFLSFNFSYWFTKIGLVFGVFSMCCMDFEFLPYFKPLAYLLLIVLYLETWKNLSLIVKKKRFKIQVLHFLVMICLTMGLSKIDVLNYKAIDETSLVNNPIIDFPESEFCHEKEYSWRNTRLALKLKLNDQGELDIFTEDRLKINIADIDYITRLKIASIREELYYLLSASILADKELDVRYIKAVEAELYLAGIRMIDYEIYTENQNGGYYYENDIIKRKINKSVLGFKVKNLVKKDTILQIMLPPLPPPPLEARHEFQDTIRITLSKELKFNEKSISKENIEQKLKGAINPNTLIMYEINRNTTYQDYITTLSIHNRAAEALRKVEQTIFKDDNDPYMNYDIYRKEQRKLREKYPVNIIETNN